MGVLQEKKVYYKPTHTFKEKFKKLSSQKKIFCLTHFFQDILVQYKKDSMLITNV